jgi:hypothetical protein
VVSVRVREHPHHVHLVRPHAVEGDDRTTRHSVA